jgi:TP901 family phage tail tape measure protein
MAGKNKTYELMLKIGGKVDGSLKTACSTADKNLAALGKTAKAAGKIAAGAMVAAATAVATLGTAAVKSAAEYEDQLANVSTLLTGTEAEVAARTAEIGDQVLEISNRTGVATADLTDGMYQVVSAFGDSADAAAILETAAKSAAAGNATTTDSINLLSAVTKGYGDTSAEAVQQAADLAFATVRLGQTSFPELAAGMGKVIPLASTLGLEQEQLWGAMATLTGVTGSTAEVVTQMKATMQAFLSPSKNMQAALKNMGYESGQALLESKGLQGSLDALKDAVGGNELAFAGLFSSVEAQTAVLAMAGNQAENLTSKTAEMYEATGAANTAFERQTNTLAYDIQMIKNLGANFLTQLGTNILPYVREFAEAALPVVSEALEKIGGYMTGTIIPAAETAVKWISEHRTLILALAAGIATAVAAYKAYKVAITAYNAVMAVYKVVTAASATGTFTLAGAMTALNLPVLAVVAAIGLAVAAGILIYKNWDKIKAKAVELGAKISEVWGNIKTGVSEAVANLVSAFQSNFPLLSAYLSGWWESVSAAWENVKAIFANIIDFVQNVFAGNWSAAWDNIVAIFGNVFGMIVNLAKAPINGVISAINWVLEKINSISVTIPDWVPGVGGKTLGFNIPTIPALAAGGIATAPTLAQIGEGGEPEAVLPLSKLAALLDEWTKPKPTPGGGTGGGGETVVFSPVFNFYGGTPSREEAEEAGRISFAEFKKLYRQMKAEEKRKQFSPA